MRFQVLAPVEPRGLAWKHAAVRGGKTRLDQRPTTEPGKHIEALKKQGSGDGQPGKLFSLRQKLGRKAKQEPKFRFYTLWVAVLEGVPVGEGAETRAGQAARDDRSSAVFQTHPAISGGAEPASERLGELLLVWLSARGVSGD